MSQDSTPLTIAVPKGRLLDQTAELFHRAGYDLDPVRNGSRKLVYDCGPLKALLLRAGDIPTYVDYGAADVGVVGRDVIEEENRDLYQPLDLGIGKCRLIVAGPDRAGDLEGAPTPIRIASKYPALTRAHFQRKGLAAEIVKLGGSVELAPSQGLADWIVDLVETGETLRQNGLREVEEIMQSSAHLLVNPARMKLRGRAVRDLIGRIRDALTS